MILLRATHASNSRTMLMMPGNAGTVLLQFYHTNWVLQYQAWENVTSYEPLNFPMPQLWIGLSTLGLVSWFILQHQVSEDFTNQ